MNSDSICIIGSGGHCRSVIGLLENNNLVIKGIYDASYEQFPNEQIMDYKLLGDYSSINTTSKIVLAIGENTLRTELFKRYTNQIITRNIFHSTAYVEKNTLLGASNLIFARVFINAVVQIGDNNILNSNCIIEHECTIGDNNHISISATLGGRVKIGNNCFIGAGSVVKDGIKITSNVIIGAGGIVIHDIEEAGTYVGNPVRKIK